MIYFQMIFFWEIKINSMMFFEDSEWQHHP